MEDVKFADAVGLAQKQIPVEVLPRPELHVYQGRQHGERDSGNRRTFFVHGRELLRGIFYGWRRRAEHKVNDSAAGVNARAV